MTSFQIIRIAFCLLGIFLAGVWMGRITAPRPGNQEMLAPRARVNAPYELAGDAFSRMDREVRFTPEQRAKVLPLFEETARAMVRNPPGSRERYAQFQEFKSKLEPHILPEQKAGFENFCKRTDRLYENRLQRTSR